MVLSVYFKVLQFQFPALEDLHKYSLESPKAVLTANGAFGKYSTSACAQHPSARLLCGLNFEPRYLGKTCCH